MESDAWSDDNADDAVFALLCAFFRISRLLSTPMESRWCTTTVSLSPPSSEPSDSSPPSKVDRLLVRDWLNANGPELSLLPAAADGDIASVFLADFSADLVSEVPLRLLSPSLKAFTLTGARVGTIAVDVVALVIGVIDGLLDAADLEVAGVAVVKDVLDDFMACD